MATNCKFRGQVRGIDRYRGRPGPIARMPWTAPLADPLALADDCTINDQEFVQ
jgi:hypothetical protein